MALYILKRYTRQDPKNSTVGTLVDEYGITAADDAAAKVSAEKVLAETDFRLPDDFAALLDCNGAQIWWKVADA